MPNYGCYLPLWDKLFDSVRFISIEPKTEGIGSDAPQKTDRDGTPLWVITALVKYQGGASETETFTIPLWDDTTPITTPKLRQKKNNSPVFTKESVFRGDGGI